MPEQNTAPSEDYLPGDLHAENSARVSRYTTGNLEPSGWTPIDNLPTNVVPFMNLPGWTPINSSLVSPWPHREVTTDAEHGDIEMGDAQQGQEEHYVDLGRAADAAAPRRYFDYASYIHHINTTDADPAEAHDQFFMGIPPTSHHQPEATPVFFSVYDSNEEDVSAHSTALDTDTRLRVSLEQFVGTSDEGSTDFAKQQQGIRKRFPQQHPPTDEPLAKKPKQVKVFFHPDEDAWLYLFHSKTKAIAEAGQHIRLAGSAPVTRAFNDFFKDRALKDENGQDLPPRAARTEVSIKNRIMSKDGKFWDMREATRKLLDGKRGGDAYIPVISEEDVRRLRMTQTVS